MRAPRTNRPTKVVVIFVDGAKTEMSWPHDACVQSRVTGKVTPVAGNCRVELHHIETDGTFVYCEVPESFEPLPGALNT